ncbi:MAG: preprotein translocase subunit SecG [Bacteroidetes bacterium]|nr:preprotein translocase subunit SecG [Bacteroidota bacterium]
MYTLVIVLTLILAALLIITILLQSSKGTGLAGSAFGSGASAVMGVRRTADFLSKFTTILAIIIGVLCISSNYLIPRGDNGQESFIEKTGTTAPASTPAPAPAPPVK